MRFSIVASANSSFENEQRLLRRERTYTKLLQELLSKKSKDETERLLREEQEIMKQEEKKAAMLNELVRKLQARLVKVLEGRAQLERIFVPPMQDSKSPELLVSMMRVQAEFIQTVHDIQCQHDPKQKAFSEAARQRSKISLVKDLQHVRHLGVVSRLKADSFVLREPRPQPSHEIDLRKAQYESDIIRAYNRKLARKMYEEEQQRQLLFHETYLQNIHVTLRQAHEEISARISRQRVILEIKRAVDREQAHRIALHARFEELKELALSYSLAAESNHDTSEESDAGGQSLAAKIQLGKQLLERRTMLDCLHQELRQVQLL